MPPEQEENAAAAKPIDWTPLFGAAGLDPSQFQPAPSEWSSLANSDARAAWTGNWPGSNRPLRIEAGAWRGKPVFFRLIGPWTRPTRMHPDDGSSGQRVAQIIELILFLAILTGAGLLARRQYKRGAGDRQGAFRLARFVFLMQIVLWLALVHFIANVALLGFFQLALSTALFMAAVTWLLYLALEPFVRKLWPQTIISWTRLISGKLRDPLVGRDVLFGVILGLVWVVILELRIWFGVARLGIAPQLLLPTTCSAFVSHWVTCSCRYPEESRELCSSSLFWLACASCCAISGLLPRVLSRFSPPSIPSAAIIPWSRP